MTWGGLRRMVGTSVAALALHLVVVAGASAAADSDAASLADLLTAARTGDAASVRSAIADGMRM